MLHKNQPGLATESPTYFPLQTGRYEVTPGLYKFPYDFGNGQADQRVFQIDQAFYRYRNEKLAARAERLHKYYCRQGFGPPAARIINDFIVQQLIQDYPEYFLLEQKNTGVILHCRLSQDVLHLDQAFSLQSTSSQHRLSPRYIDSLDALACQLQEDIAVIRASETGNDEIIALHLCLPNHWAAEDKIGKSFMAAHQAVPDMGKVNQSAKQLVHAMVHKGPFVRFAWGIATDKRLNHHPDPADTIKQGQWQGRAFNPQQPELYLRVERQTIHSFPADQMALFTIRTYFYDVTQLHITFPEQIPLLISAIQSMSLSSLNYKGLGASAPAILNYLKSFLEPSP